MDFRLGERSDAFREEVREFLREHFRPEMVERAHDSGTAHDWDFHRALGAQGWIAASWPEEYGGQGRDPFEMTAMRDELRLAGVPTDGLGQSDHRRPHHPRRRHRGAEADVPPALPGRRDHLRPRVHRARLRLRRRRREDAGRCATATTGSSTGRRCSPRWRTRPHTCSCSPARIPTSRSTAASPCSSSRSTRRASRSTPSTPWAASAPTRPSTPVCGCPTAFRVGEVDGGWDVMTVALTFERGGFGLSEADRVWQQTVDWATYHAARRRHPRDRRSARAGAAGEHAHRQRGGAAARAALLLRRRVRWSPGSRGLDAQALVRGGHDRRRRPSSSTCSVPRGPSPHGEGDAPVDGWVEHLYRHAAVTTIYGGHQRGAARHHRRTRTRAPAEPTLINRNPNVRRSIHCRVTSGFRTPTVNESHPSRATGAWPARMASSTSPMTQVSPRIASSGSSPHSATRRS